MLSREKKFFNTLRVLTLASPLFLMGCHSDFGPFPMPTGYKYLDESHKTPPGPEPVFKKIQNSNFPGNRENCTDPAQKTSVYPSAVQPEHPFSPPAASGQWGYAAGDLLGKLRDTFGAPSESVYIKAPANPSAAGVDFERTLHTAAPENGFMLVTTPGMASFTLSYTMTPASLGDKQRMIIALMLESAGQVVAEASGIYESGFSSPMQTMPAPHQYGGGDASMMSEMPLSISPSR